MRPNTGYIPPKPETGFKRTESFGNSRGRFTFDPRELADKCQSIDKSYQDLRNHSKDLVRQLTLLRSKIYRHDRHVKMPSERILHPTELKDLSDIAFKPFPIPTNCIGTIIPGPYKPCDIDIEYGEPVPLIQAQQNSPKRSKCMEWYEDPRTGKRNKPLSPAPVGHKKRRRCITPPPIKRTKTIRPTSINDNRLIGTELLPICIDIETTPRLGPWTLTIKQKEQAWEDIKARLHC